MKNASLLIVFFFLLGCTHFDVLKFSISSQIDSNDMSQVLRVARPDIENCVDNSFKHRKVKYGTLILKIDINDKGQAVNVNVEDSIDGIFDTCMMKIVSNLKYKPAEEKKIKQATFPFHYSKDSYSVIAKQNKISTSQKITIDDVTAEITDDNENIKNKAGENLEDEVYSDVE